VKSTLSALTLAACTALGGCYYAPYPYYGYYPVPVVPAAQANIETGLASQPYVPPPDAGYALVPAPYPAYPVYPPYPVYAPYPAYPVYPGYYAGPVFSLGFGYWHGAGGGHGRWHGGRH
jgi:hypothetical protein